MVRRRKRRKLLRQLARRLVRRMLKPFMNLSGTAAVTPNPVAGGDQRVSAQPFGNGSPRPRCPGGTSKAKE